MSSCTEKFLIFDKEFEYWLTINLPYGCMDERFHEKNGLWFGDMRHCMSLLCPSNKKSALVRVIPLYRTNTKLETMVILLISLVDMPQLGMYHIIILRNVHIALQSLNKWMFGRFREVGIKMISLLYRWLSISIANAQYKTVASPLLTRWKYCSLAQNHG